MRIGLTYDLRDEYLAAGYSLEQTAEFDKQETIDALAAAIASAGHEPDCIGHVRALAGRLAEGHRWDLVFNICEGLSGLARESQVPVLLDLYGIPYTFSDTLVTSVCLHKGFTKAILRGAGLATPAYRVVRREEEADGLAADGAPLNYPLFAKPVAEGTGKGVTPASRIERFAQLWPTCRDLMERFDQPALVEEFLPGREFTVGILGTAQQARVLGTMEVLLRAEAEAGIYSYVNKDEYEQRVDYRHWRSEEDPRVDAAEKLALAAWDVLGCRDAGRIDIRCDALGTPHFLEVNPLAGLNPQHSDLPMIARASGMSFDELVHGILDSAMQRVPPVSARPTGTCSGLQ